ncbi:Lsr2 family protein [Kibdelosporangium philippinense]|uniref:Lsr2 family protein n=1 Tax=Kibdelosporangium philippinense TaxID=211113 RepID=A0ABS8ZZP0_9PSEU|nr:Lsr2 family protein [Kibdelosporangium philippinense]MCE7011877.1 Lsr2 family protein [Kibdelosporangium philippinense]
MAQKTVVELVDDLDGGIANETVAFTLDGVEFQIDLSEQNATRLRDSLEPYVAAARRTGGRKQRLAPGGDAAGKKSTEDAAQNQAIREWARSQGKTVAERGRLPHALVVEFKEAHGG